MKKSSTRPGGAPARRTLPSEEPENQAPKEVAARRADPEALRKRAVDLHQKGDFAEARAAYVAYLSRRPGDAGAWSNLGAVFRSEAQYDLGLAALERALQIDPNSLVVMSNYANSLSDVGQYDRSLQLRDRILRRQPDDAKQKANVGRTLRAQGLYDTAISYLSAALDAHPDDPHVRIQLALTELADRRWTAGFRNYESRWLIGELTPPQVSGPKWDGGALDGQRILVLPEQGHGDAVAFARFLPVLRRFNPAAVLYQTQKPLERLLAGLDGADWIGTKAEPGPAFDCWVNLMDLAPLHFAGTEALPPPTRLSIPADSMARARAIAAPHNRRFKIGVVWCGSVTYRGNAFRSFSHTEFHALLDLPDIQMFSLYKGPKLAEFVADGTNALIVDAAASDRDFADCAALMMEMDLIITSDTATAHIAGSLGRPVWTLLHWDPFWLWQHEVATTPWYPSMRLLRQDRPRDWADLFQRVHKRLEGELAAWRLRRP